ncbi:hypothetical protein D6833_10260 [Candidatus Parcubacteria bacterium]|nr:MAG: hypothetical protein D6833_10260 [Candidatus Parcubacteria bacterium]
MALVTGTPLGSVTTQEDLYIEGAPTIYIQDNSASPLYNPDSDGFYWGMSGTSTYPVYELGCVTDVSLTENLTMNDVLCDNIGVKDTIQQRNYLEFNFTIQSLLPFTVLRNIIGGGAVTQNVTEHTEKFGIGQINNNKYWMVYAPKVYDTDVGDYVVIHLHKAKFVDAWTINMPFGSPWQVTGLKIRAFADSSKPAAQQFGTIIRADASVIT